MICCEVIKDFTLEKFGELENIKRKKIDTKGKLYIGDTFECTKEMADYLMGKNLKGNVVVKVIEIIPEKDNNTIEMEVSFDSKKAINKVKEIAKNNGTHEEAVKEVEKIINETVKVKPKKKKSSKK